MFEKIPSIKDFTIYVIPGLMICYCFISLVNYVPTDRLPTMQDLSQNLGLALISFLFAFIIGFVSSQLQIILLNRLIHIKYNGIRTLDKTNISEEIKDQIVKRIIEIFKLEPNSDVSVLKKDKRITELAINYLRIKSNSDAIKYFDRDANLASFAIGLPIPTILFSILLLLKLRFTGIILVLTAFQIAVIILFFCLQVTINFRRGWTEKIFNQFFVLISTAA